MKLLKSTTCLAMLLVSVQSLASPEPKLRNTIVIKTDFSAELATARGNYLQAVDQFLNQAYVRPENPNFPDLFQKKKAREKEGFQRLADNLVRALRLKYPSPEPSASSSLSDFYCNKSGIALLPEGESMVDCLDETGRDSSSSKRSGSVLLFREILYKVAATRMPSGLFGDWLSIQYFNLFSLHLQNGLNPFPGQFNSPGGFNITDPGPLPLGQYYETNCELTQVLVPEIVTPPGGWKPGGTRCGSLGVDYSDLASQDGVPLFSLEEALTDRYFAEQVALNARVSGNARQTGVLGLVSIATSEPKLTIKRNSYVTAEGAPALIQYNENFATGFGEPAQVLRPRGFPSGEPNVQFVLPQVIVAVPCAGLCIPLEKSEFRAVIGTYAYALQMLFIEAITENQRFLQVYSRSLGNSARFGGFGNEDWFTWASMLAFKDTDTLRSTQSLTRRTQELEYSVFNKPL